MKRQISGGHYAASMIMRFGILATITFAFPFFVYWMVQVTGAGGVGGAGGALALVLGIFLKPTIYLLFALSILRISSWRARAVGMSPMIGLCISLLVLCDLSFGITFGSFWAVGFSLGILQTKVPTFLIAATIAAVTLIFLDDFKQPINGLIAILYAIWKFFLFILLGLGLIELASLVLPFLLGLAGVKTSFRFRFLLMMPTGYFRYYLFYPQGLLLPFAAVSAALILESRRSPPSSENRVSEIVPPQGRTFGTRAR